MIKKPTGMIGRDAGGMLKCFMISVSMVEPCWTEKVWSCAKQKGHYDWATEYKEHAYNDFCIFYLDCPIYMPYVDLDMMWDLGFSYFFFIFFLVIQFHICGFQNEDCLPWTGKVRVITCSHTGRTRYFTAHGSRIVVLCSDHLGGKPKLILLCNLIGINLFLI